MLHLQSDITQYYSIVSGNSNILRVTHDLLGVIQSIISGTASVDLHISCQNQNWEIRSAKDKPVVIIQYPTEQTVQESTDGKLKLQNFFAKENVSAAACLDCREESYAPKELKAAEVCFPEFVTPDVVEDAAEPMLNIKKEPVFERNRLKHENVSYDKCVLAACEATDDVQRCQPYDAETASVGDDFGAPAISSVRSMHVGEDVNDCHLTMEDKDSEKKTSSCVLESYLGVPVVAEMSVDERNVTVPEQQFSATINNAEDSSCDVVCSFVKEKRPRTSPAKAAVKTKKRVYAPRGTRQKHVCQYCSKEFSAESLLIRHVRSHTGEKPFKCSYCPKRFLQRADRKSHERVHTGERPYTCSYCPKTFSCSSNKLAHERQHTGEKPKRNPRSLVRTAIKHFVGDVS